MPLGTKGNMAYPFPRLQNDGIFQLVNAPGFTGRIDPNAISSVKRLREVCAGGILDKDLFIKLCRPEEREQIRVRLVLHYFAEGNFNVHPKIRYNQKKFSRRGARSLREI